jgi:hypothetical protein
MARLSHLKKRDGIFNIFEDVRKGVLLNHNQSISKMVDEIKNFAVEVRHELKTMQTRVKKMDQVFEQVNSFSN